VYTPPKSAAILNILVRRSQRKRKLEKKLIAGGRTILKNC
jgi:hypothetical protein